MGFILLSRLWWAKDFLAFFFFILSFPGLATAGKGREGRERERIRLYVPGSDFIAIWALYSHLLSSQRCRVRKVGEAQLMKQLQRPAGIPPFFFSLPLLPRPPSSAASYYYPSRACFCESPMYVTTLGKNICYHLICGAASFTRR